MVLIYFFGKMGIICGLYIDGRLIGEIMSKYGFWFCSLEQCDLKFIENVVEVVLYVVYRVLMGFGYFFRFEKCILFFVIRFQYFGMLIDINEQVFIVFQDNWESRIWLRSNVYIGFEKRVGILGVFRYLG